MNLQEKCVYILKKGKNKGKECGKLVGKNCKNVKYCNIHDKNCKKIVTVSSSIQRLKNICEEWFKNQKGSMNLDEVSISKNPTNVLPEVKHYLVIKDWIAVKHIGKGGFGTVYECIHKKFPYKKYAMKVEKLTSNGLLFETEFYKDVCKYKNKHIPKLYDTGIFEDKRYIIIEKLFKFNFTLEKIPKIIQVLESFAIMQRIHGDIKFENIMERKNGEIVLIDFGMSWEIPKINDCNVKPNRHISGTLVFMSIFSHRGIISYRNDLETLLYCILEMFNTLPWDLSHYDFHEIKNLKEVEEKKEIFLKSILNKDKKIMKQFKLYEYPMIYKFAEYIAQLNINIFPDYNLLENIFLQNK